MTEVGTPGQPAPDGAPGPSQGNSPAEERARRLTAVNMLRSLLPLVVIVLLLVGWNVLRSPRTDPVRPIDPSTTVHLAASRAGYPMLAPQGLPAGFRPTSARTDAGAARPGGPVTLQIGYVTPKQRYAGFAISDDPQADALTSVLDGARAEGSVQVAGQAWTRSRTPRGETALSRQAGDVTVLVTGSADEGELETVAASVRPYSG
jgi:hypothetical protein